MSDGEKHAEAVNMLDIYTRTRLQSGNGHQDQAILHTIGGFIHAVEFSRGHHKNSCQAVDDADAGTLHTTHGIFPGIVSFLRLTRYDCISKSSCAVANTFC